MSRLLKSYIVITGVIALAFVLFSPRPVLAQSPKEAICSGVKLSSGGGSGCDTTASGDINKAVKTGIQIFAAIVGVIAVVMVVVGGLKFITSGGDPGKTASAQNTIIYAVVGLAVAALAQFIVQFVLNKTKL